MCSRTTPREMTDEERRQYDLKTVQAEIEYCRQRLAEAEAKRAKLEKGEGNG